MSGSKMLEKHMAAMKAMSGKKVEAGWFETARYPTSGETKKAKSNLEGKKGKALAEAKKENAAAAPTGRSVAANARVQEFGAIIRRGDTIITIPARPFMRLAWSQFSQKRQEIQAKVATKMVNGGLTPEQGLGLIGLALEAEIIRSIKNGNWEPNAASTIKKKGFDKPLIDSAHMWQSVSSKVS